jgi:hypothetical protein
MDRVVSFDAFVKQQSRHVVHPETVIDLLNKTLVACQSAERRAQNGLTDEQKRRVKEIQTQCLAMAAQGQHKEDVISGFLKELESFGIPILWQKQFGRPTDTTGLQEAYAEYLEAHTQYDKELRSVERYLKDSFKNLR